MPTKPGARSTKPTTHTDTLIQLAGSVGEVAGAVQGVNNRLDDVVAVLRDQAAATQQMAATTAEFREETAEQLGGINARLDEGDKRFEKIEQDIRALREQAGKNGGPKGGWFAEMVSWVKDNWRPVALGTAVVVGILEALYHGQNLGEAIRRAQGK